jgi:hypothetical protein
MVMQLTIDDFNIPEVSNKSKLQPGEVIKMGGSRMEVIVSDEDLIVLYCYRKEKIYPLRFMNGRFSK